MPDDGFADQRVMPDDVDDGSFMDPFLFSDVDDDEIVDRIDFLHAGGSARSPGNHDLAQIHGIDIGAEVLFGSEAERLVGPVVAPPRRTPRAVFLRRRRLKLLFKRLYVL